MPVAFLHLSSSPLSQTLTFPRIIRGCTESSGHRQVTERATVRLSMHAWAGLAALRRLWLEDNPLACAPRYRVDVLACFLAPGGLALDGRPPSRAELEGARLRGPARAPSPDRASRT